MSSNGDDTKRFHRLRSAASTTRELAGTWARAKTARLQAQLETPDSYIQGDSDRDTDRFQDRKAQRKQLKQYHDVRVDGGIIATLLEARSLMVFGPGGQFTSEDDAVAEWLNDTWNDRDTDLVDIGNDTYFYGYSLAEILETRGGDFGKLEFIQPWTTVPEIDRKGQIDEWEQTIENKGGPDYTDTYDPDDILHFKTMKASGRDPVGMSLLGRSMDEAKAYRDNQQAIQNAVQMQGFPKFHVKLGREDGAVIDDNELRRARPQFDNIHELTKWVTGHDVDIDVIEAENFEFEGITEHDLSKLAIAFMLPIELTQIGGGDGLGTGFPAKLRRQLFLLGARSHQRLLGDQIVQQIGRPLLDEYAPDDLIDEGDDVNLEFTFNDPITDVEELQAQINAIGEDMKVNERRDLFGMSELCDEDVGDDFEPPGRMDETPPPGADDGFGGGGMDLQGNEQTLSDLFAELDAYRDGFESIVWAAYDADDVELAGPTFTSEGDVPANVRNRLSEASRFVNWADTDGVPPGNLRSFFVSKLEQPQGWSIDSLANGLRSEFGARLGEPEERVNIARTKSAALLNQAKRMAFEDLEDGIDGDLLYYWDGPQDGDTTDACEELKEMTNPEHGGTPRPRSEFDSLMSEVRSEHFPEFESSGDAIHYQERHAIDAVLPQDTSIDPAGVGGMATAPGDD